jgi:hypothetical protein
MIQFGGCLKIPFIDIQKIKPIMSIITKRVALDRYSHLKEEIPNNIKYNKENFPMK